jgi:hypothetical protein
MVMSRRILTKKRTASGHTYLYSESTNFDIKYNTPTSLTMNYVVDLKEEGIHKPESFWQQYQSVVLILEVKKHT